MRVERFAFELQWLLRAIRQLFRAGQTEPGKPRTFCERIKTLPGHPPRRLSAEIGAIVAPPPSACCRAPIFS
ncbi:MAG TPA: hypothetical protein VKP60_05670 [Magnetospirillaceae bacterium]|nr:hypothetical protein [Magnetospirillaceae bacterium]